VVSPDIASNQASRKVPRWPERYSGTAASTGPSSHARATTTVPWAQVSGARVKSRHSVSWPTAKATAAPASSAVAEFHSRRITASTAGAAMSSARPLATRPRW
jgi:hypothetical protein